MDLTNLTAKVKGFQRRTTQKVLQQMGMADKTEDETPAFQNFQALGSFASQLKLTIQATNQGIDKSTSAQSHLASQIQSYLSSEFSGDGEVPPGELGDFFSNNAAHANALQSIAEKFNDACFELGGNAFQAIVGQLEDLVVRPIVKDEEFGAVTKELIEEKKRAVLDYDSYRRMGQNAAPSEQDKIEQKLRMARERHDDISRRVADHLNQRNQIRCKLLVHGILTTMQQYCNFYAHAINIFRDTANSLKPLLDVYSMSQAQIQSLVNLGPQNSGPNSNVMRGQMNNSMGSPSTGRVTADFLFEEQERNKNNGPARAISPQLDNMMRDNLNLKKPAGSAPPQQRNVPMNQLNNGPTRTPPPTHHNNNNNNNNNNTSSPQPSHSPGASRRPPPQQQQQHQPQQQQPPQQQPPQQTFDFMGEDPLMPQNNAQPDVLIDLMGHQQPNKHHNSHNIFDGDLLGSGHFAPPGGMPNAPAMQPSNVDIFDTAFKTSANKGPTSLANEFDFLSTPAKNTPPQQNRQPHQQPPQQQHHQQTRPAPTQAPDDLLFGFGNPTPAPSKPAPSKPAAVGVTGAGATQGERHELNPAVTQKITNWAEKGGRKANLRALLSTLHEVIWVDSGWDAMSLADLITAVQVKKAYHRANLIVHPDKVQNGTVEQQLMAQRIFEALRVSYETFKDEPK